MPYKVIAVGAEALAADVNNLLMEQTVARFTNATQRSADLVAPELNQLSMLDSRPGIVAYWSGTAWTDVGALVQTGSATGTTNSSGFFSFPFPKPFGGTPVVTASWVHPGAAFLSVFAGSTDTGQAAFVLYGASGSALANSAYSVQWIAVGPAA